MFKALILMWALIVGGASVWISTAVLQHASQSFSAAVLKH